MGTITNFLIRWLVNTISLIAVVNIVSGVSLDNWQTTVVTALVIGLLNSFLKPVIVILTLPVNIMTLGLFTLIINGLMFSLAAFIVKGFHVGNFWNAFWAAFIFSIISFMINFFISIK